MYWQARPTLITLEGEDYDSHEFAELLGIDDEDAELLGGCSSLSADEISYLNNKYPEYMGIWPILAKVGAVVAKGVSGIVKHVKKKRQEKAAAKKTEAETKLMQQLQQQAMVRQQQAIIAQQKAEQTKKVLMIGIPVATIGIIALMSMNRKPAAKAA